MCGAISATSPTLNHIPTDNNQTGTRDFAWWQLARHALKPHTARLAVGLAVGLVNGLVAGLVAGLGAAGLAVEPAHVLELVGGLVGGLVGVLVHWVETPTPAHQASTPLSTWRADRFLNLLRAIAGLVPGLVLVFFLANLLLIGFEFLLGPGPEAKPEQPGMVFGLVLVLGPVSGLVFVFVAGRHHAWLAYLVATYRLAWRRRLPRRLMPFLDDMHKLGLLRAVGPIYQFRHAELQDHLAENYRSTHERVSA